MGSDDDGVFILGPSILADVGVKMVMPSLATLLSDTPGKLSCNQRPISRPIFFD